MENILVALGALLVAALISMVILSWVWKFWRKSTIARIAQALAFLSLLNVFSGEWITALGGFILYAAIWRFSYRRMSYEEKLDYDTFLRRSR